MYSAGCKHSFMHAVRVSVHVQARICAYARACTCICLCVGLRTLCVLCAKNKCASERAENALLYWSSASRWTKWKIIRYDKPTRSDVLHVATSQHTPYTVRTQIHLDRKNIVAWISIWNYKKQARAPGPQFFFHLNCVSVSNNRDSCISTLHITLVFGL